MKLGWRLLIVAICKIVTSAVLMFAKVLQYLAYLQDEHCVLEQHWNQNHSQGKFGQWFRRRDGHWLRDAVPRCVLCMIHISAATVSLSLFSYLPWSSFFVCGLDQQQAVLEWSWYVHDWSVRYLWAQTPDDDWHTWPSIGDCSWPILWVRSLWEEFGIQMCEVWILLALDLGQ